MKEEQFIKRIQSLEKRIDAKDKEIESLRREIKRLGKEKTRARSRAKQTIEEYENLKNDFEIEIECELIEDVKEEIKQDEYIIFTDLNGKERRVKKCVQKTMTKTLA